MKTLKALSFSLLAALALTGTASAVTPTVIHITGSTAFRSQAVAGLIDYLSQNGTVPIHAGYTSGSTLLGAGAQILANGTIAADNSGSATIVIETFWSGSAAGTIDLATANTTGAYYDASNLSGTDLTAFNNSTVTVNTNDGTNNQVYGGGVALTSTGTAHAPDAAFADTAKATTAKTLLGGNLSSAINGVSTIAALQTAVNSSNLVDAGTVDNAKDAGVSGVVTFEWVFGNYTPTGLTNMGGTAPTNITQQASDALITGGSIAQSLLTGTNNAADSANYIYLTGRNEDSGTRLTAFSESQFGVTANPKQYSATLTGSTSTLALFPANSAVNTITQLSWSQIGHSGYASGGNVATALKIATDGTWTFTNGKNVNNSGKAFVIGYVGATDAASAISGGAHALTYNGVPYSIANIQNGSYTFWGFEHLYKLNTSSTTVKNAVDAIADDIFNIDADVASNGKHSAISGDVASGILFDGNFNVTRTAEGTPVSHQ